MNRLNKKVSNSGARAGMASHWLYSVCRAPQPPTSQDVLCACRHRGASPEARLVYRLPEPDLHGRHVHNVIGITVLLVMALTVLQAPLRRSWGPVFFPSSIILGVHTLPAAWLMESPFKKYLFTATCVWVIGAAIFGLVVIARYERFQSSSEKYLLICYPLITLGAYGAGFAEFFQIGKNIAARVKEAAWPEFGAPPHPLAGNTPYDVVPAAVGFVVFALWIVLVWIALPIWWRKRGDGVDPG